MKTRTEDEKTLISNFYKKEDYDWDVKQYLQKTNYYKEKVKNIMPFILPVRGKRLLEVGCGWGGFCINFNDLGANVTGLDFSSELLKVAKDLSGDRKIKYVKASLYAMPFERGSFDVVVALDCFEHITDLRSALKECWRVLKDDGKLVIYCPTDHHIFEIMRKHKIILRSHDEHINPSYNLKSFSEQLTLEGFKINNSRHFCSHILFFNLFERLFLFVPWLQRRFLIEAIKKIPGDKS